MKLAEAVHLHFIPSKKFKTQRIKVRFSGPLDKKTLAGRVLSAYILETANKSYPKPLLFRRKLASLYGATFETSVAKKGAVHIVDIDLSFISPIYLSGTDLTIEMLNFLKDCLWNPLTQADSFESDFFKLEQNNVINALENEEEDHFYQARLAINRLFHQSKTLSLPKQATSELIQTETPQSAFRTFQKLLTQDRIDIFCLGEFNQAQVLNYMESLPLTDRHPRLTFQLDQGLSKVTPHILESKRAKQSILELAYHISVPYGSKEYFAMLVLNGMLGSFSHSRLFSIIREKEGLAYTIGSQFDSLTSCLNIYTGIDKDKRQRVMSLIHQQLLDFRQGRFTKNELEETKLVLKNNLRLAEDRQIHLIEQIYSNSIFQETIFNLDNWLTNLDSVCQDDIRQLANKIKLQALYFMEGTL